MDRPDGSCVCDHEDGTRITQYYIATEDSTGRVSCLVLFGGQHKNRNKKIIHILPYQTKVPAIILLGEKFGWVTLSQCVSRFFEIRYFWIKKRGNFLSPRLTPPASLRVTGPNTEWHLYLENWAKSKLCYQR